MMFRVVLNVFEAFLGKIIQQGRTWPPSTDRRCEGGKPGSNLGFVGRTWLNGRRRHQTVERSVKRAKETEKVRRRLKTDWFDRSDAEMRFLIQTKCFMLEPCV